ncbi:hypothetical protein J6590_095323, partial [Homalodisca vitripennis]
CNMWEESWVDIEMRVRISSARWSKVDSVPCKLRSQLCNSANFIATMSLAVNGTLDGCGFITL